MEGYRLESTVFACPSLYQLEAMPADFLSDPKFLLFRSVLSHECVLSLEQAAHKFMTLGSIVTHELREIGNRPKVDDWKAAVVKNEKPQTDESEEPMRYDELKELQKRRSPGEDLFDEQRLKRTRGESGSGRWRGRNHCLHESPGHRRFVRDLSGPLPRHFLVKWREFRDRAFFESQWDLPEIDDFMELADREELRQFPQTKAFSRAVGYRHAQPRYLGFFPELFQNALPSCELGNRKPAHRAVLEG